MAEEKDFCTLLSKQIIDEKKATEIYKTLLDLLQEEKDLLAPSPKDPLGKMQNEIMLELIEKDIKNISDTEAVHKTTLDSVRKALCVPTKK